MTTKPSAKVIADSINERGDRLTTMQVTCHRFVLAEFNTHRRFSRNSASSRAIPIAKRMNDLWADSADPIAWPSEQPGMQGGEALEGVDLEDAMELWDTCREFTLTAMQVYLDDHLNAANRLHKSLLNRLVEPWLWHTIVVSSTEWENFFVQRVSPLAQPEIREAAVQMLYALENSWPVEMGLGDFHLPYVEQMDLEACQIAGILPQSVSAARCARVSFLTQEGTRDVALDADLYGRLTKASPPHWSPLEHVATPAPPSLKSVLGNFDGWLQLRHYGMSHELDQVS